MTQQGSSISFLSSASICLRTLGIYSAQRDHFPSKLASRWALEFGQSTVMVSSLCPMVWLLRMGPWLMGCPCWPRSLPTPLYVQSDNQYNSLQFSLPPQPALLRTNHCAGKAGSEMLPAGPATNFAGPALPGNPEAMWWFRAPGKTLCFLKIVLSLESLPPLWPLKLGWDHFILNLGD